MSSLSIRRFRNAQKAANPEVAPTPAPTQNFVGQKFNLPGVGDVTVQGFEKFTNTPGFYINTDKGKYLYYDQDYVSKGAVYDGNQYYTPQLLEYLKNGQVAGIDLSGFGDDPTATNSGRAIGQTGYIFTNPEAANLYATTFGVGSGINPFTGIMRDENGNLSYVGGDGNSFTRETADGITTTTRSGGRSFLGKLFGGIGEKIAASARDVLGNPIVQLGISAVNPAAAAGIQFGTAAGSGAPIGDAVKNAAQAYALGQAGNAVGGAAVGASGATNAIARGAIGGAAAGGTQGLLSGGNVLAGIKSGLLAGGIGAGVNQAFNGAPGSVGGIDDSNYDLGKSMQLQDMYYGRIPGALQKRITDGLKGFGQDVLTDRLTGLAQKALIGGGGLLAGGAIANGLLSNRQPQQQQMAQQQTALPVSRFGITPQVSQYGDDFSTYGERGTGGFQFYKAPVGLLG